MHCQISPSQIFKYRHPPPLPPIPRGRIMLASCTFFYGDLGPGIGGILRDISKFLHENVIGGFSVLDGDIFITGILTSISQ